MLNEDSVVERMKELFSYQNLCPLCLSLALQIFQNWSGVNVIVFKTVHVFEIVGSSIDKYLCTMVVGCVQLLSTGSMTDNESKFVTFDHFQLQYL